MQQMLSTSLYAADWPAKRTDWLFFFFYLFCPVQPCGTDAHTNAVKQDHRWRRQLTRQKRWKLVVFCCFFFFFLLSTGEINKWHKPFIIEKKQTFLTAVVFFFFFFFLSTLHLWTYILANCSYYMLLKLNFYYRIISVSLYGMAFGVYFVSEKPAGWWLSSALFTFLRRCAWCLKVYIHCVIASHESECDRSRHAYVFCPVHFRIISVAIGEWLTDSI